MIRSHQPFGRLYGELHRQNRRYSTPESMWIEDPELV
jgi:hypothetical protein